MAKELQLARVCGCPRQPRIRGGRSHTCAHHPFPKPHTLNPKPPLTVLKISRLPPGYTATDSPSFNTFAAVLRPASTAPIHRQISRQPDVKGNEKHAVDDVNLPYRKEPRVKHVKQCLSVAPHPAS